jgi:PAS domain S-box-containing protein
MAEKHVRILITEDNDHHFELILRELKEQKMRFLHERARTKAEFVKTLEAFKPDVVVSDYFLPDLDGLTAFRMTQDHDASVPFILVTGTLGEDKAVECMKAGFTDYVMKEHIGRLGPSVRAAVHRRWAVMELGAVEEKLREKEKFLENLIESLPGVTYQCLNKPDWPIEFSSESIYELTGRPAKDFVGPQATAVSFNDLIDPGDRERVWNEVQNAVKDHLPYEIIYRIRTAQGAEKWVWDKGKGVFGPDGKLLHLEGFATDITERKKAEEALRQSEERLSEIIESAPDPIVTLTALGFVQSMNPEAEHVSGYARDEVVGKHFSKANLLSPKSLPVAVKEFSAILTGQDRPPFELEFIRKDGRALIFEAKARLLRKRGKASGMQVIFRDLTERKRAEAALKESEEKFRTLASHAPVGISLVSAEGEILFMNDHLIRLTGHTVQEVKGKAWISYVHPEDRERFVGAWDRYVGQKEKGEQDLLESCRYITESGRMIWISVHGVSLHDSAGRVAGHLVTVTDMTEHRLLEDQLRQSQKMEAVGRLAGGIAHDFNNILTAITGYTELALKSDTSESVHADLEEVYKAAERAAGLTRQLLTFSRRQTVNACLIDPNELIRNMDKMLRRVIGEDVEFSIGMGKGIRPVKADPGQIEQVIMNLAVNARDALGRGGCIWVETTFAHVEGPFAAQHEGGKPGDYILLTVKDTGHGMSEEVKKHLFEPFFTTKESGKGTGLGLATCYGIVKQAGGFIDVQSEINKGTSITVYLPVAEENNGFSAPAQTAAGKAAFPASAKLLVVDDESTVRSFAARILRQEGYTVLEASSGPEALEMMKLDSASDLRLLVTDVMMPKMSGIELAEKLRASRPGVKVLFASGFTEEPLVRAGVEERKMPFLAKPFSADALVRKIREVLSEQEDVR